MGLERVWSKQTVYANATNIVIFLIIIRMFLQSSALQVVSADDETRVLNGHPLSTRLS